MRVEAFMDYLFYLMVAAGILLLVWMILTRWLGIGPPRLRRPFAVWGYVKEARAVFPHVRKFGWLLTAVYVAMTGIIMTVFLYNSGPGDLSDGAMESLMRNSMPIKMYLVTAVIGLPLDIIYAVEYITRAFRSAASEPFMLVVIYCVWRYRDKATGGEGTSLLRYILAGAVAVAVIMTFQLTQVSSSLTGDFAGAVSFLSAPVAVIKYCILLLPASVAEGIFLAAVFGAISGESVSTEAAFKRSVSSVKPLYIFNLCFFAVPYILRQVEWAFKGPIDIPGVGSVNAFSEIDILGGTYMWVFIWFLKMMFFLTPFMIVREALGLKDALRKSLQTVMGALKSYIIIMLAVGILALLASSLFRAVSQYAVLPLFRSYYIWQVCSSFLPFVFFIWFSLFAFCVFAVFTQKGVVDGEREQSASV